MESPRQKMRCIETQKSELMTLRRIEKKIDLLVDKTRTKINHQIEKREEGVELFRALDIATLLTFPDHLRKSAMTLFRLGRASAKDVAKETGKARAIECAYLNQLARMGYVKKEKRRGRRVYFSIGTDQPNAETKNPKILVNFPGEIA
jgi:DNA-binding transcriptional ArsR family regulator